MSIAPRSMMDELDTLRDRLDRFFRAAPGISAVAERISVALDVQETDDAILVKASVPGIKADDIDIEVRDNTLVIQGETREEREEKNGTWHRRERQLGRVYRAVTLPAAVKEADAEAKLHDGVLEIRLPKAEPREQRRIPVKTS